MMNRNDIPTHWRAAIGLALMLGVPSLAAAQAGSLSGTIVDDDGNPVDAVEITATPEASLSSPPRSVKTGDDGRFRIVGLSPGRYTLSYTREGFESATQDVQVRIGERNRLGELTLPRLPDDWVDPDAQVHFDAGVAAHNAGDYQKAVDSFLIVLGMAPDIPEVHYNIGFAYENLENMEKAIEHFERALELKPGYYEPLLPIADYHTAQRDWPRAAEYLKRATEIKADDVASQYNYGAVSMNAGDMDAARGAFEKVLELDPTRAMAHYQLGMIAVSQTRNDDAVMHLEKYLELDPEGPQAAGAQGVVDMLKPKQ